MMLNILGTIAILGMMLGLFTEAELTRRTVVIYFVFCALALAAVWL